MKRKNLGINTICTHVGEVKDTQFQGAISPLFMSSSYQYDGVDVKRYPRYFNTPNQEGLGKKIAALEKSEAGMIFSSGMAAVSHCLLAFLHKGDHVVLPQTLYGGTYNFVVEEFHKFGIEFTFADGFTEKDFEKAIKTNTKVIYVETPSNPLMKITDLEIIARLAKQYSLVSMIDNTFASAINQTPADFGIDIMIHSATKYMGGHSDICAGAVAASSKHMDVIWNISKNIGGSLSDYTVWLLERSLKTMALRVKAQNKNAKKMAKWLEKHPNVSDIKYPGLQSHPQHDLALTQMNNFSAMLSFQVGDEAKGKALANKMAAKLEVIHYAVSLGHHRSLIFWMPTEDLVNGSFRLTDSQIKSYKNFAGEGIFRMSVGLEDVEDLILDLERVL